VSKVSSNHFGFGFGFGFGFTTVGDWLSGLIGKLLVWFWFYDTQLKTALSFANVCRNSPS